MPFPITFTRYYETDALTALIDPTLAAPVLLAAAKIGLGTAVVTPGPATTFAELVEAGFTGYSQSATVVWGLLVNELDGSVTSLAPSHLFRCTVTGAGQSVNNFFVTDGVASPGTGILGAARISPAIPIEFAGDGFSLTVAWNFGPASANSEGVISM